MKKDNKKALYESIMTSVAKEVKKVLNEGEFYDKRRVSSIPITGKQAADYLMTFLFNEENNNFPLRAQNRIEKVKFGIQNILFSDDELNNFIETLKNEWKYRHNIELKERELQALSLPHRKS